MSEIISLLANSNYLVVNKDLISMLGLECAVFLSEIVSEWSYWENTGKAEDGWFFSTQKNIEKNTNLKRCKQNACAKKLVELGLLETEVRGMPAQKYFRINEENIRLLFPANKIAENCKQDCMKSANMFAENEQTSLQNFDNQDVSKTARNNNKDNNNKNNNKNSIPKHKHGTYEHVLLTDKQYEKLKQDYGETETDEAIEFLDAYIQEKHYKSHDHNITLRKWVFDAVKERKAKKPKRGEQKLDFKTFAAMKMKHEKV